MFRKSVVWLLGLALAATMCMTSGGTKSMAAESEPAGVMEEATFEDYTVVANGNCGKKSGTSAVQSNVTYKVEKKSNDPERYRLTVSGSGAMYDYEASSSTPWNVYRGKTDEIIVESGVTEIGKYAFSSCGDGIAGDDARLTVSLPSSLTGINDYAFYKCGRLDNIIIPQKVNNLGVASFADCFRLRHVILNGKVTEIKSQTFKGCKALKNICLPDSVYIVGVSAFEDCSALEGICFWCDGKFMQIGDNAFKNCSGIKYLSFPGKFESLGGSKNSFSFGDSGTEIKVYCYEERMRFPSGSYLSLTSADVVTAFKNLTGYPGKIKNGSYDVMIHGRKGFFGASGNDSVTFSYGLSSSDKTLRIEGSGRMRDVSAEESGCNASDVRPWWKEYTNSNLYQVSVSGYVKHVGEYAFYGMNNVTSVYFSSSSLLSIGDYCFYNSTGLKNVTFSSADPTSGIEIGTAAFMGCTALTGTSDEEKGLDLAGKISSVGTSAFASCSSIKNITFSGTGKIAKLQGRAFAGCTGLTSLVLKNVELAPVTTARQSYFAGCYDLNTLTISMAEGKDIPSKAFSSLEGLTTLTVSQAATIDSYAFDDCTALRNITLGDVGKVSSAAFDGCTGIKSFNTGNTVTFSSGALRNCKNLTDFTVGAGTTAFIAPPVTVTGSAANAASISKLSVAAGNAVYAASGGNKFITRDAGATLAMALTGENIPDTVTAIGEGAFAYRRGITSLSLPDSVTAIGDGAFENCFDLVTVNLSENLNSIGKKAFKNCGVLTEISIPEGVTTIDANTFNGCSALLSVTIPKSVTAIEANAFSGCNALATIVYRGSEYTWDKIAVGDGNAALDKDRITFLCGEGDFGENEGLHWVTENGTLTITRNEGSDVSAICDFAGFTDVPWYTYSASVKEVNAPFITFVGSYAFSGFSQLKNSGLNIGTVTAVGSYAFENCSALTALPSLGDGATIGEYAFSGCTGIRSISFVNNATIEPNAFSGCTGLTDFDSGNVTVLKSGVLNGCSALEELTVGAATASVITPLTDMPGSLKKLAVTAGNTSYKATSQNCITDAAGTTLVMGILIAGSEGQDTADVPDGIVTIAANAFRGQAGMKTVNFPTSLASIRENAFGGCDALANINYMGNEAGWDANLGGEGKIAAGNDVINKSKVTYAQKKGSIGDGASKLDWEVAGTTLTITQPEGSTATAIPEFASYDAVPWSVHATRIETVTASFIASVGDYAFYGFKKLSTLNLGAVTQVGEYAFDECDALISVVNPSGLLTVGEGAYAGCDGILSVNFGTAVTIGDNAFAGCGSLSSISIPATTASIGEGVLRDCGSLTTISVASGNTRYRTDDANKILYEKTGTDSWKIKAICPGVTTPDLTGVTEIGAGAFSGSGITSVVIPDTVTAIGEGAFKDCAKLESVTLKEGLEEIGDGAFEGCSSLEEIAIPASVTTIGDGAFEDCSSLAKLNIPAGVTDIGSSLTAGCTELKELTVADENAKYRADNNTIIEKDTNTLIAGCNGTDEIPAGVEKIGDGAFMGCAGITSIKSLPVTVTDIGDRAFYGCAGLTVMTIPEGVESIGSGAFEGAVLLVTVKMPVSVKTIGDNAFKDTGLTLVTYPGSVDDWKKINIGEGNEKLEATVKCSGTAFTMSIAAKKVSLLVDETTELTVSFTPDSIPDESKAVSWKSSDDGIVTVAAGEGNKATVTAKALGQATITVSTTNAEIKPAVTAQIKINVVKPSVTVTYKPGFEGASDKQESVEIDSVIDLRSDKFTRNGFALTGWKDVDGKDYEADAKDIKVTGEMTFTAQWTEKEPEPDEKEVHDPVHVERVEATKDKAGNIEYWKCSKCGKLFADKDCTKEITIEDTVIPKLPDPEGPKEADLSKYEATDKNADHVASKTINLKKDPAFSGNKDIKSYKVIPEGYATVNKNGVLTAKKSGHVKVVALDKEGKELASVELEIVVPEFTKKSDTINRSGRVDMNEYIKSTVQPSSWKVSDKKLAKIDSKTGLLEMKKSGTVKVKASFKHDGGKTRSLTIKLTIKIPQFKKSIYTLKLKEGKTVTAKTALKNVPQNVKVTYSTGNPAFATVDDKGVVTAVSKGTTELYAEIGGITYKTKIKVK